MGNKVSSLAAFALAATLGVAGQASAQSRLPDGLYAVEAHYQANPQGGGYQRGGCMIISNNGLDEVPSLYDWGRDYIGWGECGLSNNRHVVLQNRQAVWQVYTVAAPNGQQAYVIKSHVNGRCLIRGHNGYAGNPSLHLWTELPGGDARFCGFRNADELLRNGQAAWFMRIFSGVGPHRVVDSLWTSTPGTGLLAFSPAPPVVPNTVDRYTYASFANDAKAWFYFFVRMDS